MVDDGSQDCTAEIAAGFPCVRLVRHPVNRGYGAAIKTGFCHARGELLAFLDADGTYPPERFPALCRAALSRPADLVIGSRRSGADSDMPAVRRLGNLIWSNLVRLVGNHRMADPASGMRVLRRSALPRLYPLPDGLNFTPVMSVRAIHEGLAVAELPIPYHERVGRSKLSVVHDGTRFLKTIIWTALEYNPVRVLGLAGLAALGMAGLIGLGVVVLRLQGVTHLGPWGVFSVFSALVLGVAGVSIFSLGATFNYLVALFHRQPVPQGMFGRPVFDPPLDRHFGWMGVLVVVTGTTVGGVSLALGLNGWDITRLWFWLMGSALLVLVGLQAVLAPGTANGSRWYDGEQSDPDLFFPVMNGRTVILHAARKLGEAARAVLGRQGWDAQDLDLVVPHQANGNLLSALGRQLGIPASKVVSVLEWSGNTSSASILMALDWAYEQQRIGAGDRVLFVAFGAGFQWGAAVGEGVTG